MKLASQLTVATLLAAMHLISPLTANQTATLSPVYTENGLPFTLQIDTAPFSLPTGLQTYVGAEYDGKWIFLAGRTNGLHGFSNVGNNFPPNFQNTTVYILDPATGISWGRSLTDASSGLSQSEIDSLSVTASQFAQEGKYLFVVGGYGINTATGQMETKSTLTKINMAKLIQWVQQGKPSLKSAIRQVSDPLLQVTGGYLFRYSDYDPFLLVLGQNFVGDYTGNSNGIYTHQIRAFNLVSDRGQLKILPAKNNKTPPDYRRRDLNVVPIYSKNKPGYVAFAGVFTLDVGVWTVPITISTDGSSFEPNPAASGTFKQAMNHYNCASFGLYSSKSNEMFVVFPGGISYGFYSGGVFQTDSEIPFINQVTTIKIDNNGNFTQHLMNNEYPFIASTGSNPGNQLLFGAEAQFFQANIPLYRNGVIQLDALPKEPVVIGHIIGGIMSTLPNTNVNADSTSSPYVFTVTLIPQ